MEVGNMKKFLFFAAACVALVACNNKENEPQSPVLEKGQLFTIGVSTGNSGSQASGRTMNGVDAGTQINFTWEAGDKILVTIGTGADADTAHFTLTEGAGEASAKFAGKLPEGAQIGDAFTVQYPIETPDLSKQEYIEGKLPKNKMLMTGEGILGATTATVTLAAQYAVLQLNLWSDGTAAKGAGLSGWRYDITKIDVTLGSDKYTLQGKADTTWIMDIYPIVSYASFTLPQTEAAAMPFLMVVPAGTSSMTVLTDAVNQNTIEASSVTFTAGQCLNMPAKLVHCMYAQVIPQYVGCSEPAAYSSLNKPVYPSKGQTLDDYYTKRAADDPYATYDSDNKTLTFEYSGGPGTYKIEPQGFSMDTPLEEHQTYYTTMTKVE